MNFNIIKLAFSALQTQKSILSSLSIIIFDHGDKCFRTALSKVTITKFPNTFSNNEKRILKAFILPFQDIGSFRHSKPLKLLITSSIHRNTSPMGRFLFSEQFCRSVTKETDFVSNHSLYCLIEFLHSTPLTITRTFSVFFVFFIRQLLF